MSRPKYDDGLDDDGYPIEEKPRLRYRHGCEEDAGDWQPQKLVDISSNMLQRAGHEISLSSHCDSPIETRIGAALMMLFDRAGLSIKLCKMIDISNAPDALLLVPQFAWSYYRSDWAILNPKRPGVLLIECDGRDFHSSPEQRSHDTRKDKEARIRGYQTMRFTGSEIHREPDDCARKIFDAVCGL